MQNRLLPILPIELLLSCMIKLFPYLSLRMYVLPALHPGSNLPAHISIPVAYCFSSVRSDESAKMGWINQTQFIMLFIALISVYIMAEFYYDMKYGVSKHASFSDNP